MEAPTVDGRTVRDRRPDADVVHLEVDPGRRSMAAPALGLGGLVLLIGSFLSWASDSNSPVADAANSSIAGSSLADGRVVMGIGLALLFMALYMGTTMRRGHWFDSDLLGLALSTIAAVIIVATWVALPEGRGPEAGLYVALAGSLIAFVGTLAALIRSKRSDDGRYAQDRRPE